MAVIKNLNLVERLNGVLDDNKPINGICGEIAKDVEEGRVKFIQVIEELKIFLTDTDINKRKIGINSLSLILHEINKNFLNEQEIGVLTLFYCDRLNDHNSMIPDIVQGFLSIIQMTKTSKESLFKLFHRLFNDIRCQSEVQEIRNNIYHIIKIGLSNNLESLKLMGPDFVYGVISSMDGESDPRNLMLLFDFLPKFIDEFYLGHLTEEMFEVLACYFPVDFNSSGMDQIISRDELAEGLENCLISTSVFGEFCLPLIIEKLDSEVKRAKIDSLKLLAQGALVYGSKIIEKHIDELWPLLRRDLLPGTDEELKVKAYNAIDQIVTTLSADERNMEKFIGKLYMDLKYSLTDVQLILYWPSINILKCVAKANKNACCCVMKMVMPLCLGQYSANTCNSDKIHLVMTLNDFLKISNNFGVKIKDISELSWADMPGLYLNELDAVDIPLKIKVIEGLSVQKLLLTNSQRELIYNKISETIDNQTDGSLLNICHKLLISLSEDYSNEIIDLINSRLIIDCNDNKNVQNHRLEALAAISKVASIGPYILPIIVNVATSDNINMRIMALICIKKMLEVQKFQFDVYYFLHNNCQILSRILDNEKSYLHSDLDGTKHDVFTIISQISKIIIRKLSAEEQNKVIIENCKNLNEEIHQNIELFEGLLTPLRPCNISNDIITLIPQLIEISIKNTNGNKRLLSCKLCSTLINKVTDDKLEKILNNIRVTITNTLENESDCDFDIKEAAIVFNIWCTKALVTRGYKKSQDFFNYQLNTLNNYNSSIGEFCGRQFKIFVDKTDNSLTEDNYCIIKLFYKQKIFQSIINQNISFCNSSRSNYLTAFICLAEEMSSEILLMNLLKIVPLLIESLSLDNGQLILSTLKIIKFLLETKHEIFIEKIHSFISICLGLTTYSNMNVRITAHECIYNYCDYPSPTIKPYRDDVLEKLSKTIDDKKRLVRKSAAIARTRWFLVTSSNESA